MEEKFIEFIIGSNAGAGIILFLGYFLWRKVGYISKKMGDVCNRLSYMEGYINGKEKDK